MKQISLLLLLALFIASCTSENEEDLFGDPVCETTNMSFSKDIAPIMNANCVACHTPNGTAPGFANTYDGVKDMVDNKELFRRIAIDKDMPPAGPLTDCQISKIKAWIDDGAPNN